MIFETHSQVQIIQIKRGGVQGAWPLTITPQVVASQNAPKEIDLVCAQRFLGTYLEILQVFVAYV
jgi:hypothetical protein